MHEKSSSPELKVKLLNEKMDFISSGIIDLYFMCTLIK